jgi:hypothetical protein
MGIVDWKTLFHGFVILFVKLGYLQKVLQVSLFHLNVNGHYEDLISASAIIISNHIITCATANSAGSHSRICHNTTW